jgi:hypothetical protein
MQWSKPTSRKIVEIDTERQEQSWGNWEGGFHENRDDEGRQRRRMEKPPWMHGDWLRYEAQIPEDIFYEILDGLVKSGESRCRRRWPRIDSSSRTII